MDRKPSSANGEILTFLQATNQSLLERTQKPPKHQAAPKKTRTTRTNKHKKRAHSPLLISQGTQTPQCPESEDGYVTVEGAPQTKRNFIKAFFISQYFGVNRTPVQRVEDATSSKALPRAK